MDVSVDIGLLFRKRREKENMKNEEDQGWYSRR